MTMSSLINAIKGFGAILYLVKNQFPQDCEGMTQCGQDMFTRDENHYYCACTRGKSSKAKECYIKMFGDKK